MTFNPIDILAVLPEIVILVLAMIVVLLELLGAKREIFLQTFTVIGLLVAGACFILFLDGNRGAFNGMVAMDGVSRFLKILFIVVAALVVLMSRDYLRNSRVRHGEFYGMLLIATCGMMILSSATDLITIFLGIETMSIALYVLAGIRSERYQSGEAAIKYLLLGAFATGFLLYGIALLYGATGGKTNLAEIGQAITKLGSDAPIYLYAGVGLVSIGFLFKIAAVPFHFWSPDVYQGSPTPVTAFMAVGPKAAALIALLRVFGGALPDLVDTWGPVLWVVAAITMTAGNITALAQKDIKRMLAYSSISHAGYLLLAILASANQDASQAATSGLLFYLAAYAAMNIGAFTVAIVISRAQKESNYQIDDYRGLASINPWISGAMAIFMISLAGIPPTVGFIAKLYVFSAAVKAGYIILVVIAVLNSVVSVFYYLRIVVYMYMRPAEAPVKVKVPWAMAYVLIACVVWIMRYGLFPGGQVMKQAVKGGENVIKPTSQVTLTLADTEK
ncbi:MAG: NADH-quinone oxidoreductase subunit N [Candidatus Hatepunaea meridiana]|nr:NADH-quinone oxidoreductase subunit N [Candidatus Hatepunaea meridiana]